MSKLPIDHAAQAYRIRAAQNRAQAQAAKAQQIMGQAIVNAYYFMRGAGIDKPEYDNLSIPQALKKRNAEIKRKLHEIKVEATRVGMEAAQAAQSGNSNNDMSDNDTKPPKGNIAGNTRAALLTSWIAYKRKPDNFTPEPITRERGEKPTQKEYLEFCGNNEIFHGKTLNEILEEARKPHESPADTLKRLIKSEQKYRRHKAK